MHVSNDGIRQPVQHPANEPKTNVIATQWRNALPSQFFIIPSLASAAFVCAYSFTRADFGDGPLYVLAALFGLWAVCDWQIHCRLYNASNGTYAFRPWLPTALSMAAGILAPPAISLAMNEILQFMPRVSDLIGDVLPNALPIANSAITLLENYGTMFAVAVAVSFSVCMQWKIMLALRAFLAARELPLGRHRSSIAAAVLGMCLSIPGCLFILGANGILWAFTLEADWHNRVLLAGFACCCASYLILGWINKRVSQAV